MHSEKHRLLNPTSNRRAFRWWESIQAKLLGLVLLGSVGVAIAVGSLMLSTADELFLKNALGDLDRQNQSLANELDFVTERARAVLTTTAKDSAFARYLQTHSPQEKEARLGEIRQRLQHIHKSFAIDEACLIDSKGRELARETFGKLIAPAELSPDESATPFFKAAIQLAVDQIYRSPIPYRSADTGQWAVAMATPVVSHDSTAKSLLHIEIPLAWFEERFKGVDAGGAKGTYSFLMTREGRIILHPGLADRSLTSPAQDFERAFPQVQKTVWGSVLTPLLDAIRRGDSMGRVRLGASGGRSEVIYRAVYGGEWFAATVLPHAAILSAGTELWRQTAVVAAPVVILALLVMAWQARRLVGPLRTMTRSLDAIAEGDVSPALPGGLWGELGDMAAAFRRMVDYQRNMSAIAAGIAGGDLEQTITPRSSRDVLGRAFVDMNGGIKRLLAEVREAESRFRALIENIHDVIVLLSPEGKVVYASPATREVLGLDPEVLSGTVLADYLHAEDMARFTNLFGEVNDHPINGHAAAELRFQHTDGAWRLCRLRLVNRIHDSEVGGLIGTLHDISERQAFEEQLAHRAFHDSLTGLPNRALFRNRLEQALAHRQRTRKQVAVMFVDLDNFKIVNDSLGHQAGDTLLKMVAERIKNCLRACDTVARQGGDEFTVLLEDCRTPQDAQEVAERLIERLAVPFEVDANEIVALGSIGIAVSGDGPEQADDMLRNADTAMYKAKADGKGRFAFFDPAMMDTALARLRIESDLRHAIARNELLLHYQPVVDLETGALLELEVLIRWNHPQNGLVPPVKFIPIAEETGLIVPIGEWVLRESCRQLRQWQAQHLAAADLVVAVNLSMRQFRQNNLAESVATILEETGLDPRNLKLEITESMVMSEPESTIQGLWKLKELGIKLAVDDFGTGYSSLAYLKCLPIDVLKIDRTFVDGLCRQGEDAAIVKAIIALARSLNLGITAEGIETGEQADTLRGLSCKQGQGYFYGKPVAVDQIAAMLNEQSEAVMPVRQVS